MESEDQMTQTNENQGAFIFQQAQDAVQTGIACILSRLAHMNYWQISAYDIMDAWILWHKNRHYTEAQNLTMLEAAIMQRFGSLTFKNKAEMDVKYAEAGRMADRYISQALTIGQIKAI